MALWEVSLTHSEAARHVLERDVEAADLADAISRAYARLSRGDYPHPAWKEAAVLVIRMDCTPEALRARWEADFYDIDRAGRRRRRYRRPSIEKDWEDMLKRDRATDRSARQIRNAERG